MATEAQLKYWKSLKGKSTWNKGRKETRLEVLEKQRKSHLGKISPKKGKFGIYTTNRKGKTWEEQYGKKKAGELKKKQSIRYKGKRISTKTEFKKGSFGDKCVNWKGGRTKLAMLIRSSSYYILWRQTVFERDLYTCQLCGNKGCYIEAHHKKPLRQICEMNNIKSMEDAVQCPELWDMSNGITLCLDCHAKIDKNRNRTRRKC